MTLAEKAASVQTRYDNALARMAAKPALREDEDYVEFIADIKRQLDTLNALLRVQAEREERALLDDSDARMHAEAFIRILAEVGGPKQLRVWQKKGVGTRIYFPGELGYVSVGRDGSVWSMGPGGQTLAMTALYPAWRRAYNQANRLHAQAREEAFALAHPEEDEEPRRNPATMPTRAELLATGARRKKDERIFIDLRAYPDTHQAIARELLPDAYFYGGWRPGEIYYVIPKAPPDFIETVTPTPAEAKRDEAARQLEAIIRRHKALPPQENPHRAAGDLWRDLIIWMSGSDRTLGAHDRYLYLLDHPNKKNKRTRLPKHPFIPLQERPGLGVALYRSSVINAAKDFSHWHEGFKAAWEAFGGDARLSTVPGRSWCERCGGSGKLREYSHVESGVCFKCGGTGRTGS